MTALRPVRLGAAAARKLRAAGSLVVVLGLAATGARAQLTGGTVVAGQATIATAPNSTTITAGNNSVLRWNSFNVAPSETVRFVQPGADSRVMNWIGGLTPSQINGSLLANGQVYLLNPSGVYFGTSAVVDVGRLYAVGGSMSKEDFFAGRDRFTNLTGAVRNDGTIRGELVALIGRSVANSGSIVSPGGFIGLASGDQVLLGQDGSSIFVDAGKSAPTAAPVEGTGVANTGKIDAGRGTTVLAAGDFYSIAITHDGTLAARNVRLQGQGTGNVLVSGTIDASSATPGETGGRVEVTGQYVGLLNHARILASGPAGGGTVLVGGDFQGKNPDIRNAFRTYVGQDVTINADATTNGNGGKIIIWSDDITRFNGSIFARGGETSGNGGFAEVSGMGYLEYQGYAVLTAAAGTTGNLLLDPTDITITGAGTDTSPTFGSFTGGVFDGGVNSTSIIYIGTGPGDANSTLLKQLSGANVTVTTTSTGSGTGNIDVTDTIAYNSLNALTLTAGNNLTISSAINNSGAGALTFNSSGITSLGASVTGSAVTFNNTAALTQSLGTVTATTLNLTGAGNVGTGGARLATDVGTLVLSKSGGNTFISETSGLALQGSTAGNLDVTASGSITQAAALSITGTTILNAGANVITLTDPANDFTGAVSLNNSGANAVAVTDTNAIVLGTSGVGTGTLAVTGVGITQTGAITQAASAGAATFNGGAGVITLTQSNDFTGAVSLNNSGANDVAVTDTNALALGTSSVGQALALTAGGSITQTGAITATGGATTVTVTVAGSDILLGTQANNLGSAVPVFGGTVSNIRDVSLRNINAGAVLPSFTGLTNLRNLTLTFNGAAIALPALTLTNSGSLVISAGGIISQGGTLTVPGTASFTTGGFAITLTDIANNFTGAVSLNNTGANAVAVVNNTSLILGSSGMGNGTFAATTIGGSISQTGAITKTGATSTFTIDTGTTKDILLHTQANNFGGGAVTFATANGGTIRDIGLRDDNAAASLAGLPTSARNIDLYFGGAAIALPALTATGHLNITAGGPITQTAASTVTGTASFTTGSFTIDLTQANDFTGAVSLNNSGANAV
ncbi:MAG: filamentous hemagglutinin N-terminal domain-containing protein, partial [Opitutae bacterium]